MPNVCFNRLCYCLNFVCTPSLWGCYMTCKKLKMRRHHTHNVPKKMACYLYTMSWFHIGWRQGSFQHFQKRWTISLTFTPDQTIWLKQGWELKVTGSICEEIGTDEKTKGWRKNFFHSCHPLLCLQPFPSHFYSALSCTVNGFNGIPGWINFIWKEKTWLKYLQPLFGSDHHNVFALNINEGKLCLLHLWWNYQKTLSYF